MSSLATAAVEAVKTELWIVIHAADRMACGYTLQQSDIDRLDKAHAFLLRVLDEVQS